LLHGGNACNRTKDVSGQGSTRPLPPPQSRMRWPGESRRGNWCKIQSQRTEFREIRIPNSHAKHDGDGGSLAPEQSTSGGWFPPQAGCRGLSTVLRRVRLRLPAGARLYAKRQPQYIRGLLHEKRFKLLSHPSLSN